MSCILFVDAEYLSAAAYHYGAEAGLNRAKVDYLALRARYQPETAVAYIAPEAGDYIAFQKFLTKSGYVVTKMPPANRSAAITAQMSTDINANVLSWAYPSAVLNDCLAQPSSPSDRQVIIVTGNGSIAPLCRVLQTHCELTVLAFPGSVSRSLMQVGADTHTLIEMLYESSNSATRR
jgi:hypothetical protein